MNLTTSCDRFEREGILQIERGEPLDAHFGACLSCKDARRKYECILAALPIAEPEVAPMIGWQARVLRETSSAGNASRAKPASRTSGPEIFLSLGFAAAIAATTLGITPSPVTVEVTAEQAAQPTVVVADEASDDTPIVPAPERAIVGDENITTAPPRAQKHIAPAPAPAPQAPPNDEKVITKYPPETPSNPDPSSDAKRALEPTPARLVAPPPEPERVYVPKVVRPDRLYGFHLKYPRAAMDERVQGEVSVRCTIHADGRNTNCRILKSLPFLDEAILRALSACRSEPIKVDGRAIDNSDHIWHISIKLKDPEKQMNARGVPIVNWKNGS